MKYKLHIVINYFCVGFGLLLGVFAAWWVFFHPRRDLKLVLDFSHWIGQHINTIGWDVLLSVLIVMAFILVIILIVFFVKVIKEIRYRRVLEITPVETEDNSSQGTQTSRLITMELDVVSGEGDEGHLEEQVPAEQ